MEDQAVGIPQGYKIVDPRDRQNIAPLNVTPPQAGLPPGYKLVPGAGSAIYSPPGGKQEPPAPQRDFTDKALDWLRPLIMGGVGVGVTAAASADPFNAGPFGAPAVGIGAATGVDMALQNLYKQPPVSFTSQWAGYEPGSLESKLANAGEQGAMNEAGGMLFQKGLNLGKATYRSMRGVTAAPPGMLGDALQLPATANMQFQQVFGKSAPSAWISSIWGRSAEQEARENTADILQKKGLSLAQQISGRDPSRLASPQEMSKLMERQSSGSFYASMRASNAEANNALLLAKSNTVQIPGNMAASPEINALAQGQTGRAFHDLDPQSQQGILSLATKMGLQPPVRTVEGPIALMNGAQAAADYLKSQGSQVGPLLKVEPQDTRAIMAAKNLLTAANAKFQGGKVVGVDPISFEDAWNFKKTAGNFGWGERSVGDWMTPATGDSAFKSLSSAIDDDITQGVRGWQNDPTGQALKSWQNAKAIVAARHATFDADGLKQLIETTNDRIPFIDQILADSEKTQRFLNAGQLKAPDGTIISSTNAKRDLQGYLLTKFMQPPYFQPNGLNPARGTFNYDKILGDMVDPAKADIYGKVFSQQTRSDIQQLFKQIGATSTKADVGNTLHKLWAVRGGIGITAGLLSSVVSGGKLNPGLGGVGGFAGAEILGRGLANMLAQPGLARILVDAAAGNATGSMLTTSRMMAGALQGTTIVLVGKDGSRTPVTIERGRDGLEYVPKQDQ